MIIKTKPSSWLTISSTLILALSLLTSCASTKTYEAVSQSFQSRISSGGLKHFELRIRAARDEFGPKVPNRNGNERSGRRQAGRFEKVQKILSQSAKYTIEQNQYCREGYWIIDTDVDRRGYYLRGECNELATEADRKQFPDTLHKW